MKDNNPYTMQRIMSQARRIALEKNNTFALVDVGSSKISCMVVQINKSLQYTDPDKVSLLARHSVLRVIGVSKIQANGIKLGEIVNMSDAVRSVRLAVQAAQKMANAHVEDVIVSFSGGRPSSYGLTGQVDVENGVVTDRDISRVMFNCTMPPMGDGREAIHAMPVNFILDQNASLVDPRGQLGNMLGVDMHIMSVDTRVLHNFNTCLTHCDLNMIGIMPSAYCSGLSALVEDEKELGAACIDMGGGSTSISIFYRQHMIHADSVRIGGNHVTNDLSYALKIPFDKAERIKVLHGGVVATSLDDRQLIDIQSNTGDWNHDCRQFTRSEIIGIIRPRMEEIFEKVAKKIQDARFDTLPGQRFVLTGGASQLPGMEGLASRILGQQVRIGRPMRIAGLPQAAMGGDFSTSVGLALYIMNPQDEYWDFNINESDFGRRPLRHTLQWFKENW